MKNILSLSLLMFLVSCSNFVNNLHRQIDREERSASGRGEPDRYAAFREQDRMRPEADKRPLKNPLTFSLSDGGPSGHKRPPVKREYRPQRYQADDFKDQDTGGSLWANQGNSASLFTYQNDKHTGDIVIINVLESLRNQISAELKRTFPDKPKKNQDSGKTDPKAAQSSPSAPSPDGDMDMKIYDKISGTVTEEVSKDYVVLRGRKEVIFKKEKRAIEVQALVSRKDIMENDYVNSDKLLESRVLILGKNQ